MAVKKKKKSVDCWHHAFAAELSVIAVRFQRLQRGVRCFANEHTIINAARIHTLSIIVPLSPFRKSSSSNALRVAGHTERGSIRNVDCVITILSWHRVIQTYNFASITTMDIVHRTYAAVRSCGCD